MAFVRPSQRFRLFFDETGNGDLHAAEKNPNERYLSLTGVVVRQDHHDGYLTRRLNLLKDNLFKQTPSNPVILHRRDIMRGEAPYGILKNAQRRDEFNARIAAIVAECLVATFTVSIDKLAHKEKYVVWQYSPYHYLLECLVERFVLWLERTDSQGDIMGEARDPNHDKKLRRAYGWLYNRKTQFVPADRIRARLTSKKLSLEAKNANIAGLQIADILAHPAHRALKFAQLGEPQPEDFGSFLVGLLTRYSYDRNNQGRIEGYGTKWLP